MFIANAQIFRASHPEKVHLQLAKTSAFRLAPVTGSRVIGDLLIFWSLCFSHYLQYLVAPQKVVLSF